jgi:hypothetical protein
VPSTSIPRPPHWSQGRSRENLLYLSVKCLQREHGSTYQPAQPRHLAPSTGRAGVSLAAHSTPSPIHLPGGACDGEHCACYERSHRMHLDEQCTEALGLAWALWHLPLFFNPGDRPAQAGRRHAALLPLLPEHRRPVGGDHLGLRHVTVQHPDCDASAPCKQPQLCGVHAIGAGHGDASRHPAEPGRPAARQGPPLRATRYRQVTTLCFTCPGSTCAKA